ncbi:mediator of RNA polymerase II transcription subunit 26 isoform X2 [Belonocnema kinseyi]|uniref:mediator of RNA polymerase II transcription subunit 26 isoform X2 n=1 Tax=Belonocnema kinseyi TaxID=2817044 RepID=UPI00143CEECC|nr:mediator of RNA polymerase II transcription subunit 26 isoform X2 [Belonocnema kinseyi]
MSPCSLSCHQVTDMRTVVDVITTLERVAITKEVLEVTRLGKYVNDIRRKLSNAELARRMKDLVRRWRTWINHKNEAIPAEPPPQTVVNGVKSPSPAQRSPALRGLQPQSPMLKAAAPFKVLSPALSVNSESSRSPNVFPGRQPTVTVASNHRLNFTGSLQESRPVNQQNHTTEAVPRTHSSNKRLRKNEPVNQPGPSHAAAAATAASSSEPAAKRPRLNGEGGCSSSRENSQVPSPSPSLSEPNSQHAAESAAPSPDCNPTLKKRGRKKGSSSSSSKSIKLQQQQQQSLDEDVKEKLASIGRNPKVKTTQELLADLQARGSNSSQTQNPLPSHSIDPPNVEDVLRSEDGPKSKYLRSTRNNLSENATLQGRLSQSEENLSRNSLSSSAKQGRKKENSVCNLALEEEHSRPWRDLSPEEILAKLPPLDPKLIEWSDCEEDRNEEEMEKEVERPPREVTEQDLERLNTECVEGLNGNFQPKLSSLTAEESEKADMQEVAVNVKKLDLYRRADERKDEEFREWHEMLARPSYDSQILHILPYVIID